MKTITLAFLTIAIALMMACSNETGTQNQEQSPATSATTEHVFSEQEKALRKAENINKLIQDAAENQRRQMEALGGN